jgi:hypothetical protein
LVDFVVIYKFSSLVIPKSMQFNNNFYNEHYLGILK